MENIKQFPYIVAYGRRSTMRRIKSSGYRALNPKTMKWYVVDGTASYQIRKVSGCLYELRSDIDLIEKAKDKNKIRYEMPDLRQ